jgi:hypothetical protein
MSDHGEPDIDPLRSPSRNEPYGDLFTDVTPAACSIPPETEPDLLDETVGEPELFSEPDNFDELLNQIEPPIGTIDKEHELDFDRAIPDQTDPEVLTVPHKQSGERLRLRKGFSGARIVDLENKVVDHLPPIDENNYDISRTVIDEDDVGIATLTSFRGDRVKVRR